VPSEKRARQRAGRQARREAIAKRQKRRRQVRSAVTLVIIATVVVGSVYLITHRSKAKATVPNTPQGKLEAVWQKAGCPTAIKGRVNNLLFPKGPTGSFKATASYQATVTTDVGTFVIALDPKGAPTAVKSFVFLARQGFYNCNIFHRVIQGFVDQTGDPTGTGTGGGGYQFTESGPPPANPQYPLGSVALANSSQSTRPTTNQSQWFVVTGPSGEALPANYVLFGRVTSGMSVLQKIGKDGSLGQVGTPKVYHRILSVNIKEG